MIFEFYLFKIYFDLYYYYIIINYVFYLNVFIFDNKFNKNYAFENKFNVEH